MTDPTKLSDEAARLARNEESLRSIRGFRRR